jgi:PTH1 family peptidyl-tRNA hydrolase
MLLVVGLGNPGARYENNRHNVGWKIVDAMARAHGFGPWRERFSGFAAEGRLGAERVIALKPTTFMNLSGNAVVAAMQFYKLAPADVVVIHDEIDLVPGKVRAKLGGGAAGNKGVRDIAAHIGADFRRVRIGVGHPGDRARVEQHVLGDFSKAERAWLDPLIDAVVDCLPLLAAGDDAGFHNRVALLAPPPPPAADADAPRP